MTLPIEEIRWKSPETLPSDVRRVLLATDREEMPPRVWFAYCATDRWYWYGGEPVNEPILGWAEWPKFRGGWRTMTLTASDVAMLVTLRDRLPQLDPHDRDYVLCYAVALYTAGVPKDAQREFSALESLVIQFGWRLAYCRYVERFVQWNEFDVPMDYEEWASWQKKS